MSLESRLQEATRYLPALIAALALILPFVLGAATGGSSQSQSNTANQFIGETRSAGGIDAPSAIIQATNSWRAAHGKSTLTINEYLTEHAQAWAEHMASTGEFKHSHMTTYETADGKRFVMSENIFYAVAPTDAQSIIEAWENSTDGHAENQLFDYHQEIGIGVTYDNNGRMWVVQEFGSPIEYAKQLRSAIGK